MRYFDQCLPTVALKKQWVISITKTLFHHFIFSLHRGISTQHSQLDTKLLEK
jgi:hypothetical protein